MASTITKVALTSTPSYAAATPVFRMEATLSLGNPYAAGGIALTEAQVTAAAGPTCTTIQSIIFDATTADGTHSMVWDSGNGKVLAFVNSTAAEAGAVDLSAAAKTSRCIVTFI